VHHSLKIPQIMAAEKTVGEKIKQIRELKKVSKEELA
jgi:DNA-binding transcriptional regulator YiaG